jgi:hypothetical protein
MKLIERERRSVFSSPPRKNSEEWHELQLRVDAGGAFIDDLWLYHWKDRREPPEPFRLHKTQFRQCTPSDISKNGWAVLKLAVGELSGLFTVRLDERDFRSQTGQRPTYKLEWLLLNRYYRSTCNLGIYRDECVVAAADVAHQRSTFFPFHVYQFFHQPSAWKNMRYQAGYRHFQARFDIGYSFATEQQQLPCSVSYGVDVCVHNFAILWAEIDIDGTLIPAPYKIPLRHDLSDLVGKIERINSDCRAFVQKLGASYLTAIDGDSVYKLARRYTHKTKVPRCVREDLETDPQIDRCHTHLDVLLLIMKAMNFRPDDSLTGLIPLTQKFLNPQEKRNDHIKKEQCCPGSQRHVNGNGSARDH